MTNIMDQGWYDLAQAIVVEAVEDWRVSNLKLKKMSNDNKKALDLRRSCERFFLSNWFDALTGVDGRLFLRRLKEGFSFE